MKKPRARKIDVGTYRVTFSPGQSYVVIIPLFWVALGDEAMCRSVAIESASEHLPTID
jgi:hypothetical protein